MYEGYSTFGGIEVVNNQRAWTRARAGGAGWYLRKGYPEIETAFNEDYFDPETAPWFDPALEELSSRFFGVYGLSLTGTADSVRTLVATPNSGDGGVLGSPRRGMRSVRVRATLLARGRDALEYGQAWLQTVMSMAGCGQSVDCDRADMLFFADVPESPDEAQFYSRYLKHAAALSGPFVVTEMESRGVYAVEMEWTWTSERPYVYGPRRDTPLTLASGFALIQDSPINYVKYPNAQLEEDAGSYTRPILARNMAVNPSLRVNATGWAAAVSAVSGGSPASYLTHGRQQGVSAVGTGTRYSYRAVIKGNGSTSASGVASLKITTAEVDCTTVPANRLMQASIWADKMVLSGDTAAMTDITVNLVWLTSGGSVVSTVTMTADARGNGLYTSARHAIPATATKCRVEVSSDATWTSGNTDATNSEVRLYADTLTVAHVGSV